MSWALTRCGAQRLLDYIEPDFVHVMIEGKIVQTGGKARQSRAGCCSCVRVPDCSPTVLT